MSLRIAMVVPVPFMQGERAQWSQLAHRYIPLAHARAQAEAGHEVHLFFDGPKARLDGADGVTVHVQAGILPTRQGSLTSIHLVKAALRLKPDVLHLHHLMNLENLGAASRFSGRVFAEYHGGSPSRWWVRRRLARLASQGLSGAFFPSVAHHRRLVAAGSWHRQTPCHISPETTSRFDALCPHPEAPGLRALVVARCEAPKDPWATLATIRCLLERAPQAEVRWACPGGHQLGAIQAVLGREPRLAARVRLEAVSLEDMAQWFAWADVAFSTSEREVGATVLSEALSQGTPFVAFELSTYAALGQGCAAVQLIPARDPARLAAAIISTAGQPQLRFEARQHFQNRLSYAAIAAQRATIYLS